MFQIIIKIFSLVIISVLITPFIRKLAFVLGAVDNPNARRVNKKDTVKTVSFLLE